MCIRITSKYWVRDFKDFNGTGKLSIFYRKTDIARTLSGYGDGVYTADDLPHPSSAWNECATVEKIVTNYTPVFKTRR